jgi:hypothetical protein
MPSLWGFAFSRSIRKDAVTRWLATPFPGEARHARKIIQIDQVL